MWSLKGNALTVLQGHGNKRVMAGEKSCCQAKQAFQTVQISTAADHSIRFVLSSFLGKASYAHRKTKFAILEKPTGATCDIFETVFFI